LESENKDSQVNTEKTVQTNIPPVSPAANNGEPVLIEPDLNFIFNVAKNSGDFYKKCFQCGTCSATCSLSPDTAPFPRKEIAWAVWGMKKQLMQDPDIWLCYQCNDCSVYCPRGARPGEVMNAIRQECVKHYSFPRFLGKWVNAPSYIPLLLAIPALLLILALYLKEPIANVLGIAPSIGERIIFSYTSMLPHWLLIPFFLLFSALAFIILLAGGINCWQAMKRGAVWGKTAPPVKPFLPSLFTALKDIFAHSNFSQCTKNSPRFWSHICVFFGFLGLGLVALWIITAGFNPLLGKYFVYPFSFWNPWKVLANLGGISFLAGILLMIKHRFTDNQRTGAGNYADWALIITLLLVVVTGFFTEVLHYIRLEPHRQLVYFLHLTFVLALIIYLPYSKLAHIVYRTIALIFGEISGRNAQARSDRNLSADAIKSQPESAETAA